MVKRVTIKEVAAKAGVSHATVSRALNNHKDINIDTRNRIKLIAKEMNYVANHLARGLVTKTSKWIGVVIPDITNPFFSQIIEGIEDIAELNGRSIILANANHNEEKEVKAIVEMDEIRVEGLIVMPVSTNTIKNIQEIKTNTPIVYVCADASETGDDYVTVDDYNMGYMATKYLLDLGHKDVIFVGGGVIDIPAVVARRKGFTDALRTMCIEISEDRFLSCNIRKEAGYETTKKLIKKGNLPTGIVAGNDYVALGVMEALDEHDYRVPEDISIIGLMTLILQVSNL